MGQERDERLQKLAELEELIDHVNDIVYAHDFEGNMLWANQTAVELLGYTMDEIESLNIRDFVDAESLPLAAQKIREKVTGSADRSAPYELLCWAKEGREIWLEVSTQIVGERITGIARDVTERRKYQSRLEELSLRDPLTGLYNARTFHEALFKEAAKGDLLGRELCLLLVDIDDLTRFNDLFGHQMGDVVLQTLGSLIAGQLRPVDYGGRVSGELFAVLLPEATLPDARQLAEQLRAAFAATPYEIMDRQERRTLSVGLARYAPGEGAESLIARAREALVGAKQAGKDRVWVATDDDDPGAAAED